MRLFFTILFLSFCLVATSGQQNIQPSYRSILLSRIQKASDSVAIRAAKQIDSIMAPGEIIIYPDEYPIGHGFVKTHYWYYLIKHGDTLFIHFR